MAYGLRIGVRVDDAALLERVVGCLPAGARPAPGAVVDEIASFVAGGDGPRPGTRRFHVAYVGATRVARSLDLEHALSELRSQLEWYVAVAAKRRVFVEAGVVGWRGRAIVLPGPAAGARTVLVSALVHAGATLSSERFAVIDERGRVHPYVRSTASAPPLPVGTVVLAPRSTGPRTRPTPLSRGHGVLGLLAHATPARFRPEPTLAALRAAVSGARVVRAPTGNAAALAPALLAR